MINKNKKLLNNLIEKHGGSIERVNNRLFWKSPKDEFFHLSTVFLRRMLLKPATKEVHDNSIQEVPVNGGIESVEPERRSEEVAQIAEKIEEERIVSETPKKKKKNRKKKPIVKVENETKQGEEEIVPSNETSIDKDLEA
jgi:hypothetical protein